MGYCAVNMNLEKRNAAQHSIHLTSGILRDLQAFFSLRVYPALKQNLRPPARKSMQTCEQPSSKIFLDKGCASKVTR